MFKSKFSVLSFTLVLMLSLNLGSGENYNLGYARAEAQTSEPKLQSKSQKSVLDDLFAKCDKSFPAYEEELLKIKNLLKGKYVNLSQEKIDELSAKSDAGLNFLRLHWPDELKGKDVTITIYRDCASLNSKAREILTSDKSTASQRRSQIQEVSDCISVIFTGGHSISPPFGKMLSCYNKQVEK